MGYKITLDAAGNPEMFYDQDATIGTDLLLSAMIPQGAFFLDPAFGLREMPKKISDENVGLVEDYFEEASKWLIDSGKAKSLEVLAERDAESGRVNVKEEALQANDQSVEFETFVPVV